ncbi:MAG: hypothetical protein Q9167_003312 [Letrouitia subvulpina]
MESSNQNISRPPSEALEARWRELTRLLELPEVSIDKLAVKEELDYIVQNLRLVYAERGLLTEDDSENAGFHPNSSQLSRDSVTPTDRNTVEAGYQSVPSEEANPQREESNTTARIAEPASDSAEQSNLVTASVGLSDIEQVEITPEQQLEIKNLVQEQITAGNCGIELWGTICMALYERTKIVIGPLTLQDFWNSEGRAKFGLDERMVRKTGRGGRKVDTTGARASSVDLLDNNDDVVPSRAKNKGQKQLNQRQRHPPSEDAENTEEQIGVQALSKTTSRLPGSSVSPFNPDGSESETQITKPTKLLHKSAKRTRGRQVSPRSKSGVISDQRRRLIELANIDVPRKRIGRPPKSSLSKSIKKNVEIASPSQRRRKRRGPAKVLVSSRKTRQGTKANLAIDQHKDQSAQTVETPENEKGDQVTAIEDALRTKDDQNKQSEQEEQGTQSEQEEQGAQSEQEEQSDQNEKEKRPITLSVGDFITDEYLAQIARKKAQRKQQASTRLDAVSGNAVTPSAQETLLLNPSIELDSVSGNVVTPSAQKKRRGRKRRTPTKSDSDTPLVKRRSNRITESKQTTHMTRSATKAKGAEGTLALGVSGHTRRKRKAKADQGQEAEQAHRSPDPEIRGNEDEASGLDEFFDATDFLSTISIDD